ncbi:MULTISPECIES: hypothetical protein [unclassified Sinorhizobium]|uniref:hypothetical protein n=1 Tax=unclassified Sinorhizobium TaxID=2613772 RepID=UPI0035260D18
MSGDPMKTNCSRIISRQLTTCGGADGGKTIILGFMKDSGGPVSLEMPFDQAASLVMTLPHLLSSALKLQTGEAKARYVFSIGEWKLESAQDPNFLILTMQTPDGFEVAFAVPVAMCEAMGKSLTHHAPSNPTRPGNSPLN